MSAEVNPEGFEKLDDVMLAMDVVDTLRHERNLLTRDLNVDDRRAALIKRLRGIYDAQGIDVPDDVLMDGVMALEEERFQFTPAKDGFGTKLAKLYIGRKKWLPLVYSVLAVMIGAWAVNYMIFTRPGDVEMRRTAVLLETDLPEKLTALRTRALGTGPSDEIKTRLNGLVNDAQTALRAKDADVAQTRLNALGDLTKTLEQSYSLRVVNKEREPSGVFLSPRSDENIRNYYLIVQPVNNSGDVIRVQVEDEEYKRNVWTSKFGVRVTADIFNGVGADKADDQIIQDDIIGVKKIGAVEASFGFDRPGGFITEW